MKQQFSPCALFIIVSLLFLLPACANKKKQQYAGIDGDYVAGTPLSERSGGANFMAANVNRTEFSPVAFAFDSTSVSRDQQEKINNVAQHVRSSGKTVIVAGFTDDRGTEEYNRSLGERRALAVRQALIEKGVAGSKVQTVSFGKEMPVDPASNETAWAKNRRAEFGIVK
ncbi:MAG: OmpA family protein [Chthoniobacterales bacterium]|nr:OmpA family protein [Chthoniobacterales bacterium]